MDNMELQDLGPDICKTAGVMFSIRGDQVVPNTITSLLGVTPSYAFAKGDEFRSASGIHRRGSGVWQLRSEGAVQSTDLEVHAGFILQQLEPKRDIIATYVNSAEYFVCVRVRCEMFEQVGSFGFSSNMLARLSSLCEEVIFTFIANCGES